MTFNQYEKKDKLSFLQDIFYIFLTQETKMNNQYVSVYVYYHQRYVTLNF